ncbi:hypothetical protein ACP4OV_010982 [Aristida adscensionis]
MASGHRGRGSGSEAGMVKANRPSLRARDALAAAVRGEGKGVCPSPHPHGSDACGGIVGFGCNGEARLVARGTPRHSGRGGGHCQVLSLS